MPRSTVAASLLGRARFVEALRAAPVGTKLEAIAYEHGIPVGTARRYARDADLRAILTTAEERQILTRHRRAPSHG